MNFFQYFLKKLTFEQEHPLHTKEIWWELPTNNKSILVIFVWVVVFVSMYLQTHMCLSEELVLSLHHVFQKLDSCHQACMEKWFYLLSHFDDPKYVFINIHSLPFIFTFLRKKEKKKGNEYIIEDLKRKKGKKSMEVLSVSSCTGPILYLQQVQKIDTIVNNHSNSWQSLAVSVFLPLPGLQKTSKGP